MYAIFPASSIPWIANGLGLLYSWAHNLFPPYIWVKSWRGIYSCIACLEKVDLTESISLQVKPQLITFNLKAHLSYRHWLLISIEESSPLATDFTLRSSPTSYHYCTGCIHSYWAQLTPCTRCLLTLQEGSLNLWQVWFFNLG